MRRAALDSIGCLFEKRNRRFRQSVERPVAKETYGIYADDDNVFVYDNDIHQYAYNTGRHTFRIQNTAQDRYLTCELDTTPTASSTVNVRVKTQGISSFPSRELQMLVLKRADGKAWLWNEENRTGLVIRIE